MSAIEQVCAALIERFAAQGINAAAANGLPHAPLYDEGVLVVEVQQASGESAGFLDYLGERVDDKGATVELYGRRMEIVFSLSAYAPAQEGAAGCTALLEKAEQALLRGLPSGLKLGEVRWGECAWCEAEEMFLRRGEAHATAFFTAEADEDGSVVTDFKLRGVLTW
ncbi:MAG: hypothetical protein IJA73_04710 [Oscillospiraceae bacterium]|nr:hypothetical protein [Oscillospiraceae bacterium]